jgi:predicted GNAT superfamily acetyltransferase
LDGEISFLSAPTTTEIALVNSNLEYRKLVSAEDMGQAEEMQRIVWGESETDVVPRHFLLALARNGGLVLGAFDGDKLVGFLAGFLGTDQKSPDRPAMTRLKHASHMMGVLPEYRSLGIGFRLKYLQREDVIENGVRLATWTYDPLQSRNAYLNIRRLGAVCSEYIREYYGDMRDEINIGYPSDRFRVDWWVTSRRVQARVDELRAPLDLANYLSGGVKKAFSTQLNSEGIIHPTEAEPEFEGTMTLVEIPSDIDAIREKNSEIALSWRLYTRNLFEEAFSKGYIVTDFVFLKGEKIPRSYYVLSHGEGTLG